jgi:parallel beta-helix repeat protein
MKLKRLAAVLAAAAMLLGLAAAAGAVDGTIEINQAKVLAAGGFPFVIASSGSYRLTSNLTVPAGKIGIQVTAGPPAGVTIDLNGFSIIGPGASSGPDGISDGPITTMTVENGSVTGFAGTDGVGVGANGFHTIVKNVQAYGNSFGIIAAGFSLIEGCTANQNTGGFGIECNGGGCTITGNVAVGNNSDGIFCVENGCTISGNTANFNQSDGIHCGSAGNGQSGCLISNNTINGNTSNGIFAFDATTGYGGNVLNGNGTIHSGGTSLGNNLCNGTVC